MMPSGKAGFSTRINHRHKLRSDIPNAHLPVSVIAADTGSVAIKTMPKAKPPVTRCQYQGMANAGLVSEPTQLSKCREGDSHPQKYAQQ